MVRHPDRNRTPKGTLIWRTTQFINFAGDTSDTSTRTCFDDCSSVGFEVQGPRARALLGTQLVEIVNLKPLWIES